MSFTREYLVAEPSRAEVDGLAGPVLLEFGAPWCGWCLEMQEHVAALLEEFPEVRHLKVHDGKGQPLGRSFRVRLWPNFVFLRDGRVLGQLARPSSPVLAAGFRAAFGDEVPDS